MKNKLTTQDDDMHMYVLRMQEHLGQQQKQ